MLTLTPTPVLYEFLSGRALEFVSGAWSSGHHFVAQNSGRVAYLATLPELVDLAALTHAHRRGSIVAQRRSPTGELEALPTSSDQCAVLLKAGYTLVFERVNDTLPQAEELCSELASTFGLLPERSVCNVFVTPPGGGIYKHFDDKDVWVVGIRGEKVFTVAENLEFPSPIMNSMESSAELRQVHPMDFSPEMPSYASDIIVRRDTTLYIPPGYWHATNSAFGSWTLSFGLRRPSWRELILSYLSADLLSDPEWRAFVPALGAVSEPKLARRLDDLCRRIQEWSPSNVLHTFAHRTAADLDAQQTIALSSSASIDVTDDGILVRDGDVETLIECDDTIRALVTCVRDSKVLSFEDLLRSSLFDREELLIAVNGLTKAGVFEVK